MTPTVEPALRGKQKKFADIYLSNGFNATRAYMEAYGKNETQYNLCGVEGGRNLKKPKIKAYINYHMEQSAMGRDEVLARLRGMASIDIGEFIEYSDAEKSMYVDLQLAKERGLTWLIKEITQDDTINIKDDDYILLNRKYKIKTYDSQKALVDLARIHGLFGAKGTSDDPVHNVTETVEEWKQRQENRRQAVAGTMVLHDDMET